MGIFLVCASLSNSSQTERELPLQISTVEETSDNTSDIRMYSIAKGSFLRLCENALW